MVILAKMVRSGLQKQVLQLYKQCLRSAENKPGISDMVKREFKKNSEISKLDSMRIEQLLRNGQRKLKMIQDPHVNGMGRFVEDK